MEQQTGQPQGCKPQKSVQMAGMVAVRRWWILLLSSLLAKLQCLVRAVLVWWISAGPMPSHIAIIMDGNRRFADKVHLDRHLCHSLGYDSLLTTLTHCYDLHVKVVTLYAFSVDNFKRPASEVSSLMYLMQSNFERLVEKEGLASKNGLCIRVLGNLQLLPQGVRRAAEKAMSVTRNNSSLVVNLCICYTSTLEIARSVQETWNNFLAACNGTCSAEDFNADGVNSSAPFRNGHRDANGGKGDGNELIDFNTGNEEEYNTKSRPADRSERSSAPVASDGTDCSGLRRRNQLAARPSNSSDSIKKLTNGKGGSDLYVHMDMEGKVNGNGFSPREIAVHEPENDNKGFEIMNGCQNDRILKVAEDVISEKEIEKNLYTYPCPPPDILIRTSGETRLSNFLMWQSSFSHLAFCEAMWPEFSFRHLYLIILEYQKAFPSLVKKRQCYSCESWSYLRPTS